MSPPPASSTLYLLLAAAAIAVVVVADGGAGSHNFTFHGFAQGYVTLSGSPEILPSGLLQMTNDTPQAVGHAFFPSPLPRFDNATNNDFSFSTTFVFGIVPRHADSYGDGITFAFFPRDNAARGMPGEYLGLFNDTNKGYRSNHVVAVEFDTVINVDLDDINNNHVGIDVNSPVSNASAAASYFDDRAGGWKNLSLTSGEPIQAWIDFDGRRQEMNVTISPLGLPKPSTPLLRSFSIDLSSILSPADTYVGFTSSTGTATESHYVSGWSFCLNGEAAPLDRSRLPSIPTKKSPKKKISHALIIGLSLATVIVFLVFGFGLMVFLGKRRRKFAEVLEDWESEYGPHRFSYRELYKATNGFCKGNYVGGGGFGTVYRGVLPTSMMEVAVKKFSNDSRQGMKEFVAEIASMGRLRHRNLVQLFGYCRREGELLLVYEFMPNGSLDRFLFYHGEDDQMMKTRLLSWTERFRIIKGIASGLLYLHVGGEQVVVHRDIKAGNVLIDGEMNGKLSDFGLARLHNHGDSPGTTRVIGTLGYMAPELSTTGKATTATDVYAFGCFLLEITCGRRPVRVVHGEEQLLVDWVLELWKNGDMTRAADPRMGGEYNIKELERVLQLGMHCSHPRPAARPCMKQVVQVLEGDTSLPETSPEILSTSFTETRKGEAFDEFAMSLPLLTATHILRRSPSASLSPSAPHD